MTNRLGLVGTASLTSNQIYSEKWDDADAVGPGEGEDWEDEVDRELEAEGSDDGAQVKTEMESPKQMGKGEKRKKVVIRRIERPKTVHERFPTFEKDKVLNFTELFKGFTVQKSRVSRRPFQGAYTCCDTTCKYLHSPCAVEAVYPRKREVPRGFLASVVGDMERQVESQRVEEVVASSSIEGDLRRALEVCIVSLFRDNAHA